MTRSGHIVVLIGAMTLLAGACGGSDDASELLVSAASSLTNAFADVEAAFEAANPGVDVILNLAGSSALREQILTGAPVDVFAPADTITMDAVESAGATTDPPLVFARNSMRIAVPVGNPAGVTGLADFGDPRLLLGLCAEGVPCGAFARTVLRNAGVVASIDTNEPDVRSLLTKIEAGELDAGIVYVTDVVAAGGTVDVVHFPSDVNVVADYPIATLAGSPNPEAAAAFVAFILSDAGRAILEAHGFATP